MKEFIKNENGGQVTIVVALAMTIFIAMLAFVVDFGSFYLEKNRLQKIADAAALAGAQEMPENLSRVEAIAKDTIRANNGDPNNFSIQTNNNHTRLDVIGRKKIKLYFGNLLGLTEPEIQARASIELQPITSVKGAIPLGIPETLSVSYGSPITLKEKVSDEGKITGIILSGPGASDFASDIIEGYDNTLTVGEKRYTRSGGMTGPTITAIRTLIATCPNATYDNYPPGCGRVAVVPVYRTISNKQVEIVGFASIFLESVSSPSSGAVVTGRFMRTILSGETSPTQADFGVYGYKLTQ